MSYRLTEEDLIRHDNYGEMFRDALISLTGIDRVFAKFHQSEVFPVHATFENEQAFKQGQSQFINLIKKLDAMALKVSRQVLFGDSEENHEEVMATIGRLLIDIYRQRRWCKKNDNSSGTWVIRHDGPSYGSGYFTAGQLPKIIHRMDFYEIVDTRAMDDKAREVGVLVQGKPYNKKKFYRWTRQNFNRFKMSRKNYHLKYNVPAPEKL